MPELSKQEANPTLTLCGGTQMTKALVRDQPFVIGSGRAAQFRIPHPSVAARHAVLRWDGRRTKVENVSEEFRLRVNGTIRFYSTNLSDNDVVRVGDFEFLFHDPAGREDASSPDPLAVSFRGAAVVEVPLSHGLTFGSGVEADVKLDDEGLLPVHALIEQSGDGFTVVDKGGSGLLANGRFFDRRLLFIGDRLDVGEHHAFVFDGCGLRLAPGGVACGITAQHLTVSAGGHMILSDAGLSARAGELVGIIGPSGSGKTTLLRAVSGLESGMKGSVLLNRTEKTAVEHPEGCFGYVPREIIVHLELTGRQSLRYAAALRLPAGTPAMEIEKLIARLAEQLGIGEDIETRACDLSGSQLKRLGIAVELLSHPPLLLLDEPASGLDPGEEMGLMRLLRELTGTGCTVVCTTQSMENLHLMDSVEVLAAAKQHGEPGTIVFRGKPSALCGHFGVDELSGTYQRLREKKPSEWRKDFEKASGQSAGSPKPSSDAAQPPASLRLRRRPALLTLLRRRWRILFSDRGSLLALSIQPLVIGLLIAAATAGGREQSATRMFLACVAAFWMACGNAALEIVRERSIFERDRFAGVRIAAYLGSKFVWLCGVSIFQQGLVLAILRLSGTQGDAVWQFIALGSTTLAATGIGLSISSWARTVIQAMLIVPVVTIPQILFSGYLVKVQDWNRHPIPRVASRFCPGFASQRIVDTSLLWHVPMVSRARLGDAGLGTSYDNLSTALFPASAIFGKTRGKITIDEFQLYLPTPNAGLMKGREFLWSRDEPPVLRVGVAYAWLSPALTALCQLTLWAGIGAAGAAICLRRRD